MNFLAGQVVEIMRYFSNGLDGRGSEEAVSVFLVSSSSLCGCLHSILPFLFTLINKHRVGVPTGTFFCIAMFILCGSAARHSALLIARALELFPSTVVASLTVAWRTFMGNQQVGVWFPLMCLLKRLAFFICICPGKFNFDGCL